MAKESILILRQRIDLPELLDKLNNRKLKKILFCGTGALLSPTSTQQGLPIPGVCHAVCITGGN